MTSSRGELDGTYNGGNSVKGGIKGPLGGGIEVHRGPLTYALRPNSTVEETVVGCIGGKAAGRYDWNCSGTGEEFPTIKSRDVQTVGNWSYAIDPTTFQYVSAAESGASVPAIPFSVTAPPAISILVKAKNIGDVWSDAGQCA